MTGCSERKNCLNYESFEEFYYNNNVYILPDDYNDIYSKYDFVGKNHQIGYTIGVYDKVFSTYVLDSDTEENILFQKDGRYFWFKEGFEFPNVEQLDVSKILIEKLDSNGYIVKEKEYALENISINELFIVYKVDQSVDTFLTGDNNFLTFRIKYIYDDYIITKYYDKIAIYNNKVFLEKFNELNERQIYVVNDEYALNLYECILNIA